jgi:adenine-specific DNA-methyltransferase
MSSKQIRADVLAALNTLAIGDLQQSTTALLNTLGYASNKTLDLPNKPEVFVKQLEALLGSTKQLHADNASLPDWKSAAFLFQLTNDELPALAAGQLSLLAGSGGVQAHQIESFVFIAIDLKPGTWSRTRLALLTREVNRLFPMPAVLLFRHPQEDGAPLLSVAVIHRRANKRDASRDVIEGKVSIIKDIDLAKPHAAHLRILESMALTEVDAKYVPSNFDKLYEAWLKVLDVKELNNRFYEELARWYYWAIAKETGVVFPLGQPLESSDDPFTKNRPTVAMIRLLTRLIFVWFLKEKRLVPAQLFDEKALSSLLIAAPHLHANQGNYYQAILQNLFFATLNTEMTDEDEDGNKQRVWREAAGPKRMDKYLIHTVYRYQSAFKDADAALALFRQVPFLNGGLFECLDKLITPEDIQRDPSLKERVVTEGKQTVLRADGFSERPENPMHIPNELFFGEGTAEVDLNDVFGTKNKKYKPKGLLKIFDSYKFTIEENTPVEEEVALDPELLGKVFENLLASYNPDTKTTARKKSGSFYTPREVVDYMVDEALVSYLNKPLAQSNIAQAATKYAANGLLDLGAGPGDLAFIQPTESQEDVQPAPTEVAPTNPLPARLRRLLSYRHTSHDFSSAEAHTLIAAIEQLRVLDPACGSGAFPMGMLQKLVAVLRKLDPDNTLWKAQNRAPLIEQLASAKKLPDPNRRDEQITAAQAALDKFDADFADPAYADYARKLYLIEKCLYGVDIQPIAVQIAKLRFFISLVVEQKLGTAQQRTKGQITPLPNLETKIVAANTLLPIPRNANAKDAQLDIVGNKEAIEAKELELREANASHFAAKRFSDKRKRKDRILLLRDELAALLKQEATLSPGLADQMAVWDPFDQNRHADFFDPEWMFGFQQGFDIVIGNPPYVRQEAIKDDKPRFKPHYATYNGTADLYVYFYERSFQLLKPGGCLSFITSNKWFHARYGGDLRQYMTTHTELLQIIDLGDEAVFKAAAYTTIVIATKAKKVVATTETTNDLLVLTWDDENPRHNLDSIPEVFAAESFAMPQRELKVSGWQLEPSTKRRLLERLRKAGQPLGDYCKGQFYYGIKTGLNKAFVIPREKRDELVSQDEKSIEIIKPYLKGRNIKRWFIEPDDEFLIYSYRGVDIQKYRAVLSHLKIHKAELSERSGEQKWYELQASPADTDRFTAEKIIYPDIATSPQFAWDIDQFFSADTTFMIPNANKSTLGILNSSVTAWFFSQISPSVQNGYFRFKSQYCQQIPIPATDTQQANLIECLVNIIIANISRPEYERLLNGLVYELFFPEDLHAKNIRLFDACTAAGIGLRPQAEALAADAPQAKKDVAKAAFALAASNTAEKVFHPSHPIYGQLFELQTLEVVRLIEGDI